MSFLQAVSCIRKAATLVSSGKVSSIHPSIHLFGCFFPLLSSVGGHLFISAIHTIFSCFCTRFFPPSACLTTCFPLCAVGSIAKRLSALTFTCIQPSPYCILKGKWTNEEGGKGTHKREWRKMWGWIKKWSCADFRNACLKHAEKVLAVCH